MFRCINNSNGTTIPGLTAPTLNGVREKYQEKFGIRLMFNSGHSVIEGLENTRMQHFKPAIHKPRARQKYNWLEHDPILVSCASYPDYVRQAKALGLVPVNKGTMQCRRSTFRTAGFAVTSWKRGNPRHRNY